MNKKLLLTFILGLFITLPSALAADTSYLGRGFEIQDTTFSSSTYVLVESIDFNTSKAQTGFGILSSFNLDKTTGGGPNEVYMRIDIDSVTITDQLVRTINDKAQPGVSGIDPAFFSIAPGEHTIDIYMRRDGNGNILFYNVDFSMGEFETTAGYQGRGNFTSFSETFQSLTPTNIFSKEINRNVNTSTYISLSAVVSATDSTDVVCRFRNGGDSPYFIVSIPDSTSTRSVSTNYITEPETFTDILNISCFSTNNELVTIEGGFIEADMKDNNNNTINHMFVTNTSTNYTNYITLGPGTHLLTEDTFTMQNGTNNLFSAAISASSTTGAQIPKYFVNASGGVNASNCYSEKERYHGNADTGSIFFYPVCEQLVVGETYDFGFWVTIDAGESLNIYDEAISLFENTPYDISVINIAPIVSIVSPNQGDILSGIEAVSWSISDAKNDTTLTNITLTNSTGDYVLAQDIPSDINSYNVNLTSYTEGDYNLTVSSCENETVDLFCGENTIQISVIQVPAEQCNSITGSNYFTLSGKPFGRMCEWNDFDSNLIFKYENGISMEVKMSNYDLSPCQSCECNYSIFYPNGTSFVLNYPGEVNGSYCIFRNTTRVRGEYTYELFFTNEVDNGQITGSFIVNEYGIRVEIFMAYLFIYLTILTLSYILVYKFATNNGNSLKEYNMFIWAGFLDLVLYVVIEVNGFGGAETLIVDIVKMLCFASGAFFLVQGMFPAVSWKKGNYS